MVNLVIVITLRRTIEIVCDETLHFGGYWMMCQSSFHGDYAAKSGQLRTEKWKSSREQPVKFGQYHRPPPTAPIDPRTSIKLKAHSRRIVNFAQFYWPLTAPVRPVPNGSAPQNPGITGISAQHPAAVQLRSAAKATAHHCKIRATFAIPRGHHVTVTIRIDRTPVVNCGSRSATTDSKS